MPPGFRHSPRLRPITSCGRGRGPSGKSTWRCSRARARPRPLSTAWKPSRGWPSRRRRPFQTTRRRLPPPPISQRRSPRRVPMNRSSIRKERSASGQVAVLPVQGSGKGDKELTAAMRRDSLRGRLAGRLAAPAGCHHGDRQGQDLRGQERISGCDCPLGSPDTRRQRIGRRQAGQPVPAGALDNGWGGAALAVAQAAAPASTTSSSASSSGLRGAAMCGQDHLALCIRPVRRL